MVRDFASGYAGFKRSQLQASLNILGERCSSTNQAVHGVASLHAKTRLISHIGNPSEHYCNQRSLPLTGYRSGGVDGAIVPAIVALVRGDRWRSRTILPLYSQFQSGDPAAGQ